MDIELLRNKCYEKYDEDSIDKRRFDRYLRFLQKLQNSRSNIGIYEIHHILPVCIFPEYKKSNWNKIKISGRLHYLAHWELAKIFGGKNWFSFNQMKRIINKNTKTGILYEYGRKYISEQISKSNTGRIRTAESQTKNV